MPTEIVAYTAISLDGYVAREDGTSDLLERFGTEEFDFHGFFGSVGGVAMGSTTYERILDGGRWPYGSLPGIVLTTRRLDVVDGGDITFSSDATADALRSFAATIEGRLWVVGGGTVILAALEGGAIDTLELYVMPTALGSGVPLFPGGYEGSLVLRETRAFSTGAVKLVYSAT